MNTGDFNAIIFDLGGVILNLDYNRTAEAFKQLGLDKFDDLYAQAQQTDLFDKFETGQISAQHFINSLLPYLPAGTSPNKIVHAWDAMILNFPKERLDLLDRLRETHRIFLLSNTNEIHLQAVRRSLAQTTNRSLESYFEKIYLSHEIKLRKPHQEIFEFVCNEQNLTPANTLFIDDTIRHIKGADSCGLQTFFLDKGTTIEMILGV